MSDDNTTRASLQATRASAERHVRLIREYQQQGENDLADELIVEAARKTDPALIAELLSDDIPDDASQLLGGQP